MPATASAYDLTDPFDPRQNINAGVAFLGKLTKRFGTYRQALAAYNWGPSRVTRKPDADAWPDQVRGYVAKVLDRAAQEEARAGDQVQMGEQAPPRPRARPPEPPSPHRGGEMGAGLGVAAVLGIGIGFLALLTRRGAR